MEVSNHSREVFGVLSSLSCGLSWIESRLDSSDRISGVGERCLACFLGLVVGLSSDGLAVGISLVFSRMGCVPFGFVGLRVFLGTMESNSSSKVSYSVRIGCTIFIAVHGGERI